MDAVIFLDGVQHHGGILLARLARDDHNKAAAIVSFGGIETVLDAMTAVIYLDGRGAGAWRMLRGCSRGGRSHALGGGEGSSSSEASSDASD